MNRAVCIGECMVELHPVGPDTFRRAFAGDAYNTAVYLKRSAPELDVQFLTVTGADPLSGDMRRAWAEQGVGDALAATDPSRRPGLYAIETDAQGERSFHYWRGESAARGWAQVLAAQVSAGALDGAALVYLSGISLAILTAQDRALALDLLEVLRGRVGRIAFDPNVRLALWSAAEARGALEATAALGAVLLPSRQDLGALYGDADPEAVAARLADLGAAEVAVTAETGPCMVREGATLARVASPAVARVVDTSGAGDSFNGGYLAARLRGAPPVEAARAGLALAAQVVTRPGAVVDASAPSLEPPPPC